MISGQLMPGGGMCWYSPGVPDYPPGWYFSDEADDSHGPFDTKQEMEEARMKYIAYLNNPGPA